MDALDHSIGHPVVHACSHVKCSVCACSRQIVHRTFVLVFDELFSLHGAMLQIARERNPECVDLLSDVVDVKWMCVVLDEWCVLSMSDVADVIGGRVMM